MESILTSTKKLLGLDEEYTHFDTDIVIHINSALFSLMQLGVGPASGYTIKDKQQTWVELLGTRKDMESVKVYVYLKVRLAFDPPQTSFLIDAIKNQIAEIEWRLKVQSETPFI